MSIVLITGGTGLVGQRLTTLLLQQGHEVRILSRNPTAHTAKVKCYEWNIDKSYVDKNAFKDVDTIIHLAGANIAEKHWTKARRKEIIESRSRSTETLYKYLSTEKHSVTSFMAASAVGYYGDQGDSLLEETASKGSGFLSDVCAQWELATQPIAKLGIRVCTIRIGLVFAKEGGVLPKISGSIPFGISILFGDGKQYMPWIHIDDLCSIFIYAMQHKEMQGIYNACHPNPLPMKELLTSLSNNRHLIDIKIPKIILHLLLGKMAQIVLMSSRASAQKLLDTGFSFSYHDPANIL